MMIEVTTPDGRKFNVKPDGIDELEDAQPGLWAASAKSVIMSGGQRQAIRESVAEVKALAKAKGVEL